MVTKAERERIARRIEDRRNKMARVFSYFAGAAGLSAGGYFVLIPNPNFYVGIVILFLCVLFIWFAALDLFSSFKWRSVATTSLLLGSYFAYRWVRDTWEEVMKERVALNLSITLTVPPSGISRDSFISISNNGPVAILEPQITCNIRQLDAGSGRLTDVPITILRSVDQLLPGGDAQTQGCLFHKTGHPIAPIQEQLDCADITVSVSYIAQYTPALEGEKKVRFAYGYSGQKGWTPQPVSSREEFCP